MTPTPILVPLRYPEAIIRVYPKGSTDWHQDYAIMEYIEAALKKLGITAVNGGIVRGFISFLGYRHLDFLAVQPSAKHTLHAQLEQSQEYCKQSGDAPLSDCAGMVKDYVNELVCAMCRFIWHSY